MQGTVYLFDLLNVAAKFLSTNTFLLSLIYGSHAQDNIPQIRTTAETPVEINTEIQILRNMCRHFTYANSAQ